MHNPASRCFVCNFFAITRVAPQSTGSRLLRSNHNISLQLWRPYKCCRMPTHLKNVKSWDLLERKSIMWVRHAFLGDILAVHPTRPYCSRHIINQFPSHTSFLLPPLLHLSWYPTCRWNHALRVLHHALNTVSSSTLDWFHIQWRAMFWQHHAPFCSIKFSCTIVLSH